MTTHLAFLGPIGTPELIVLAIIGLLVFGRRLPEVGRSLGKGIVEFKKGHSGVEDELKSAANSDTPESQKTDKLDSDATQSTMNSENESTKSQS